MKCAEMIETETPAVARRAAVRMPNGMLGFEEIKEPKPSGESNAQEATHEEFMAAVSEGEKKESKKK